MRALVLSGGGSKGSYQIGVWKALKKLHIKYDIVTGTSVGAINGVIITQKEYKKAVNVWKKINLKLLFNENPNISNNTIKLYKMYVKNFIKNGGIDITNLETLIKTCINKKKFYKSKINYGLIAYNITNNKPLKITKKDIPKDKLTDYIIASASCYPAFPQKEIDGKKYIDGGYYDNLPINLALEMGADEIIAVDLNAPGLKRLLKQKAKITYITPNNKLTNFLNFNEKGTLNNINYGYNDTMKIYNKLEGKQFTFKKNQIEKIIKKYKKSYFKTLNEILNYKDIIKKFEELTNIEINIKDNKEDKIVYNFFLNIMENLGKEFKIDETKIYNYHTFNKKLITELKLYLNNELIENKKDKKQLINLYKAFLNNNKEYLQRKALISPIEFLNAVYLYTITGGKKNE